MKLSELRAIVQSPSWQNVDRTDQLVRSIQQSMRAEGYDVDSETILREVEASRRLASMTDIPTLVIVAGDSGVYAGLLAGGAASVSDGTVHLTCARHLRRYYVEGRSGDGSVSDLATRGLSADSPSISDVVAGVTTLLGVRRVLDVHSDVAASFGVL